jgi:hypothetical protein
MRDIKSESEIVMAVDTLYSCLNECLDKAVPKTKMQSKFAAGGLLTLNGFLQELSVPERD